MHLAYVAGFLNSLPRPPPSFGRPPSRSMPVPRICRTLAFFALAATLAWPADAADVLRLIDGSDAMHGAAARARFARVLAQEIEGFLQRVGSPDPEEGQAVTAELAAIGRLRDRAAVQLRGQRLYDSTAFQQLRLRNTLSTVNEALECAASPYGATRREMACWSIAAAYLAERELYEDALAVLVRSGRLGYGDGMTRASWLLQPRLWSRYAAAIQDYVTLPYLRGALN